MCSEKNIRFGVLGTGAIVRRYGEACRAAGGIEVVAIASRDLERARATAEKFGIPRAHGSYEALLANSDVDVVINALHNGLHCEWTIQALQAGKHVLCEKPLGCNADEVTRMFAAARESGRWLMEGFMFRFHPQIPLILQRVRNGEIGRLLVIHSHRMSRGREPGNPRYDQAAGGGAMLDIGCYCVNLARAMADAEPTRAIAHAHFDEISGVDLTLAATLEFPGNSTAQFCCSFESEPSYGAEVVGTEGRIVFPNPWMPPMWPTDFTVIRGGKAETVVVQPPGVPHQVIAPFALELAHFADCVRENRAPQFPPDRNAEADALGNARAIDAVLSAARSGEPRTLG